VEIPLEQVHQCGGSFDLHLEGVPVDPDGPTGDLADGPSQTLVDLQEPRDSHHTFPSRGGHLHGRAILEIDQV
jgi:hypothetical protein